MYAFIVGSPRSGTTLLANLLNRHPEIGVRYEPYYVWERYFPLRSDDVLSADDATPRVSRYIAKNFENYKKKTGYRLIIDKSPRSSLRIPFINQIFPGAKWIHIIRDGRDATLSIYKRWQLMDDIAQGKGISKGRRAYLADRLSYEPFWSDKLRFLRHEAGPLLKHKQLLSRLRWNGAPGWGPRFSGYQQALKTHDRLGFCACQWLECIRAVEADMKTCKIDDVFTVSYESLIQEGISRLKELLRFLDCEYTAKERYSDIEFRADNTKKWKKNFSNEQLQQLHSILAPQLKDLGYETP